MLLMLACIAGGTRGDQPPSRGQPPLEAADGDAPKSPDTDNRRIADLIEQLAAAEIATRWQAAYALGQAGPRAADAVEPLMAIAADRGAHEYVRGTAVWALGRIGPGARTAVPTLIDVIGSNHVSVRRDVALALADIIARTDDRPSGESPPDAASPSTDVPPLLQPLLHDDDSRVRANAAQALWELTGATRWIDTLARMTKGDPSEAYPAITALGQIAATQSPPAGEAADRLLGALVKALDGDDADVRRAAARAIGQFGPGATLAVAPLLDAPEPTTRRAAVEALGWIGRPARDPLIGSLENDQPAVRRAAVRALTRLAVQAAEEPASDETTDAVLLSIERALVSAAADPDEGVRREVGRGLRRLRAAQRDGP